MTTRTPRLRELRPGMPVTLPTGHAAVVVAVDRERGHVDIESVPWRACFRPQHLRVEASVVILNTAEGTATGEEGHADTRGGISD